MENQQELTMNEETLFIKWLIDRVSHDFIKGKLVLEFSWANCHQGRGRGPDGDISDGDNQMVI